MLKGQIALVTGASRGIGKAIAQRLGILGATVIGTATSDAGATAISEYMAAEPIQGSGYCLNVCDVESIDRVLAEIKEQYGQVSILVNNAGITRDNLSLRLSETDWDAVLETNLKSAFRLSQALMRGMMKARYGRIINITSVVGHTGNPGQANYCASKAGLSGLTKALARELGSRNVTVNCVAPGLIETDMTKVLDESQRQKMLENIPLGRLGQPEEVAAAVAFLASAEAAFVTGSTIHVNGGMSMD